MAGGLALRPSDVASLRDGRLVVVDGTSGRAAILSPDGNLTGYLETPTGFRPAWAAAGPGLSIYLLDPGSSSVYRYDSRGRLAGLAYAAEGDARFADLATDKLGQLYLSDGESGEVLVLNWSFEVERRIGGFGETRGLFVDPTGIDVDEGGRVYVCDTGNSRVQVFDEWGALVGIRVLQSREGAARPQRIAIDKYGNCFVADSGCACLRVIAFGGDETFRLEGTGPGRSFLAAPGGMDVRGNKLYVADAVAGEIQVFVISYASDK